MQVILVAKVTKSFKNSSHLKGGMVFHGKPVRSIITNEQLPLNETVMINARITSIKKGLMSVIVLKKVIL